jgi:putative ABC transport system ATP-binding protein
VTDLALECRGLSKRYGKGDIAVDALRNFDLQIGRGDFVSIMGPSGSGKSTLLQLLGLLDAPTTGSIHINGRDASRMSPVERTLARRQHLGFVFQSFHLIPRASAIHNVLLPMALAGVPRRERGARARKALADVGLADRARHQPQELSGGQKQRVAIARALALDPPIIMADEPTGNLDSTTSAEVMQLFSRLHQEGRTIIQVTHEIEMAHYGQRIIHVKDGSFARQERRRQ